jgi:hypothetical protein
MALHKISEASDHLRASVDGLKLTVHEFVDLTDSQVARLKQVGVKLERKAAPTTDDKETT